MIWQCVFNSPALLGFLHDKNYISTFNPAPMLVVWRRRRRWIKWSLHSKMPFFCLIFIPFLVPFWHCLLLFFWGGDSPHPHGTVQEKIYIADPEIQTQQLNRGFFGGFKLINFVSSYSEVWSCWEILHNLAKSHNIGMGVGQVGWYKNPSTWEYQSCELLFYDAPIIWQTYFLLASTLLVCWTASVCYFYINLNIQLSFWSE